MAASQKVVVTLDVVDRRLLSRIAVALEDQTRLQTKLAHAADATQENYHDAETMGKVLDALMGVLSHQQSLDVITQLQNQGILFRERTPNTS